MFADISTGFAYVCFWTISHYGWFSIECEFVRPFTFVACFDHWPFCATVIKHSQFWNRNLEFKYNIFGTFKTQLHKNSCRDTSKDTFTIIHCLFAFVCFQQCIVTNNPFLISLFQSVYNYVIVWVWILFENIAAKTIAGHVPYRQTEFKFNLHI